MGSVRLGMDSEELCFDLGRIEGRIECKGFEVEDERVDRYYCEEH